MVIYGRSEAFDAKFENDELIQKARQHEEHNKVYATLFQGMVFHLYPETPRQSLEFVIVSFGGRLGDAAHATHIVTERQPKEVTSQKEFVQPQWVYDCVNQLKVLGTREYGPDRVSTRKNASHLS